jgi:hypothetical protein
MPGPFDNYGQPWEQVPRGPFSDLGDIEPPAFDPAAFPTTEDIVAEMEAEQAAPQEQAQLLAAMPTPSWAAPQISPEAEAELTGIALEPSPEYSADLTQRDDGFAGQAPPEAPGFDADLALDPTGVISPESTPLTDEEIEAVPGAEAVPVQNLSDESLAMRQLEMDQEREAYQREREREELDETTARKLRNAETYEASIAKANERTEALYQRSQDIGAQKVDTDRWFNSRSTAGKIGVALAVLASGQLGIASGRGGNESMDLFQSLINQDIETQKFNIQKGIQDLSRDQGIVATLYKQTGDLYEATETARLASYEAGLAKIDGELARMDPEGTQAVAMEVQKRQLHGKVEAQRAAIAAKHRADAMEEAKHNVEIMDKKSAAKKRDAEVRKLEAETKKLNQRGGGGGAKPKVGSVAEQEHLVATGYLPHKDRFGLRIPAPGEEAARLRASAPSNPGSVKEDAMTRKYQAEATKAEREIGPETLAVPGVVDGKGKPVLFQDSKTALEVAKLKTDTFYGAEIMDSMIAAIEDNGWSSDTLRSPEWQRAKTNAAELTIVYKDVGEYGVIAGADLDLINAQSGLGDDVTGVRNPIAGLKQARHNLEKRLGHRIKGYREDAVPPKIPRRKRAPSKEINPSDVNDTVSSGLRPDIAGLDPSDAKRKASVAAMRSKIESGISKVKDPYGMRVHAKELAEKVAAGELTESEAIDIASPLGAKVAAEKARKLGKKHRADIQKLSVAELKDPNTKIPWLIELRRYESLANQASQHPAFRKEVWKFLTEEGE